MNLVTAICAVTFVACGFGYFYWAIQMIRGRKEGVRVFDRAFTWNPFNICFRPDLLTEDGLRARTRFFICLLTGVLSILLLFLTRAALARL